MTPPPKRKVGFRDIFASRRMAVLFGLGFSSGLPLLLTGQTLTAWLTVEKVSLKTIGTFALVGLAYNFKWAWAPLFDRYRWPFLGRRRGWIAVLQALLVLAIAVMGTLDPRSQGPLLAAVAATVAFLSASQDVVIDAHRTELLSEDERAGGSAIYVLGYRVAMLITGTAALIMADFLPWPIIYGALAALMAVGFLATLFAEEPPEGTQRPRNLVESVWRPIAALLAMRGAALALLFVAIYKVGEAVFDNLKIPFLKQAGFTFTEIATLNKALGFAGVFVGGLAAGVLVARMGVRRSLLVFGMAMAATNLLFLGVALTGRSYPMLAVAVFVDNVAMIMSTSAFLGYVMGLCDPRFTATQYALLSSLQTVLARVLSGSAGGFAQSFGWPLFIALTTVAVIPALLLTLVIPVPRKKTEAEAAA